MSKREEIENRTEIILAPILEESGFELWDVGYVKEGRDMFLRIFIDKPGGITIDDCVSVSRRLSDRLDAEDLIEDAYTLEVSSPGLGRKLVKDREFEKSLGRDVDIRFYKPVDGTKDVTGKLVSFDSSTITIDAGTGPEEDKRSYSRSDIATVRLSVDF